MGLRGSEVQILSPRPTYDIDASIFGSPGAALKRLSLSLALILLCLLGGCDTRKSPYEAFGRGQFAQSLAATRGIADDTNPAALNFLGIHYYLGTGVPRDFVEAGHWFERAARLGNADAQRNIGVMYLRGLGVRQDDFLAYAWFTEAAERGNRRAEAYLALMGDALTPSQVVKARHVLDDEIGQRAAD